MVKILGVHIANGYSSEASMMSSLLAPRDASSDVLYIHHQYPGDQSAERFGREARATLVRADLGWRPDPEGKRSRAARTYSRACLLASIPPLLKISKAYAPDVVISLQQRWDCFLASVLSAYLKVPHVIYLAYPMVPWLGREVLHRLQTCDHVVAISEFIRRDAIEHGVMPSRVTTIVPPRPPCAVPPAGTREAVRAELGLAPGATVIGIAARLDPSKGQKDTIDAFARVCQLHPSAHLLIVGERMAGGTPRAVLEAYALRAGLAGRVSFVGFRPDFPRVLAAMDIFIHPSRNEALGFAPAEASGSGLPVVAYADGGTPEIIRHGETGLLARPGDIDGLASHLLTLLDDPQLARRMGQAGRQWFGEAFGGEAASRAFIELLGRVSDANRAPASDGARICVA